MNPHDEMDITAYLQTKGKRLAAELMAAKRAMTDFQPATPEPRPLQADADAGLESPKSLGDVLQGMGVIRSRPAPRGLKRASPEPRHDGKVSQVQR